MRTNDWGSPDSIQYGARSSREKINGPGLSRPLTASDEALAGRALNCGGDVPTKDAGRVCEEHLYSVRCRSIGEESVDDYKTTDVIRSSSAGVFRRCKQGRSWGSDRSK